MKHYIYLTKNKVNNKIYIGKRKCPENIEPENDKYIGSGSILRNAIKKYGIKNFEKKILVKDVDDLNRLNELEKKYIKKYNSTKKDIGYNRTSGGDGGWTTQHYTENQFNDYRNKHRNKKCSEETKQKLREKVNIQAVLKNLKAARLKHKKLIESGWRQKFSPETRKKMSDSGKGKRTKKVLCVETNIVYDSLKEAAIHTNSSISKISLCCNGKRNKTNNHSWKFYE